MKKESFDIVLVTKIFAARKPLNLFMGIGL